MTGVFHAENEQKAKGRMAAFSKSPKPHDIKSALSKMRPRLQAKLSGCRDRLPTLFVQTNKEEKP